MKKKYFIILFVILLLFGCSPISHIKLLKIPSNDFRLNSNTLKSNGYYYCKRELPNQCKVGDTTSRFLERYVSAFILYADGYAYFTGNLITSGVKREEGASFGDYCNGVTAQTNTYERALEKLQAEIQGGLIGKASDQDKGVYDINGNSIKFQIYQSGGPALYFAEYEGTIINDSTFIILKETFHDVKMRVRSTQLEFHFKASAQKVDSANYIRDHRDRLRR